MPKDLQAESSALDVLRELIELADKYPHLLQYVRLAAGKEPRLPAMIEHARKLVALEDDRRKRARDAELPETLGMQRRRSAP